MKLSILICTIGERETMFNSLIGNIHAQIQNYDNTEILPFMDDGQLSIGYKRNILLNKALGEYICFIDDDDNVTSNYVKLLMEGINKGVDCCSLRGRYSVDDIFYGVFEQTYCQFDMTKRSKAIQIP